MTLRLSELLPQVQKLLTEAIQMKDIENPREWLLPDSGSGRQAASTIPLSCG
jgi:hypothetical protein